MAEVVLGIDLGTTNSAVAIADGGEVRVLADANGRRLVPSVVAFPPDGRVLVGEEARERRLVDAKHTVYSVKRLIGRPFDSPEVKRAQQRFAFELAPSPNGGVVAKIRGQSYTLTEISAFVLREIRRVAEEVLQQPCTRAVLTVPANFNELQRSATKAAGRVAGLDVARIVNEPTAAALGYGYGKKAAQRIAVYDFGGGTFDITLLELDGDVFEVLSTAGDTFLGGDDVDLLVAERMADACVARNGWDPREDDQAFERLRAAGEWAKCQLSAHESAKLTIEELAYRDDGQSIDLAFEIGREDFERAAKPLIERSFDVCHAALRDAALTPKDLDAVILVGGSTRMPLVRGMVRDYFGREPRTDVDPDLVVAQGAALHAYALVAPEAKKALRRLDLGALEAARPKPPAPPPLAARAKQPAFAPPPPPAVPPVKKPVPPPPPPARLDPFESLDAIDLAPVPALPPPVVAVAPAITVHGTPPRPPSAPPAFDPFDRLSSVLPAPSPGRPSLPLDDVSFLPGPPNEPGPTSVDLEVLASIEPPPLPPRTAPSIAPAVAYPVIPMDDAPAPLLMDVTPHSLGLEMAGGYCELLIRRNAPVPTEQMRIFTTGQDDQTAVCVRVSQGEGKRFADNQMLGEVELDGLRRARRGALQIEVTFVLDASGTLAVRARDAETGREQTTRIVLVGGASDAEIEAMRARQDAALGAPR